MTPKEFKAIRLKLVHTQKSLAKMLEMSRRQIQRYESGETEIPLTVERCMLWIEKYVSQLYEKI